MAAEARTFLTEDEYIRLERASYTHHECRKGEIFALVGASREYTLIAGNSYARLHGQLRKRPWEIYTDDMRVKNTGSGLYAYPDIAVACGEPQFSDDTFDTLTNPTVIIEVPHPRSRATLAVRSSILSAIALAERMALDRAGAISRRSFHAPERTQLASHSVRWP